jgi:hypothetical protein
MGSTDDRITEWTGGQLGELISVLSGAAMPSRIEVFGPDGGTPAGEVHLLAGGLNDAMAGDLRGQDAVAALQKLTRARFVIETRLPDPESGSLTKPGPAEGNLATRPLVELMRYCEDYVLTCTLEVWRGEEQARLSYRRGELVATLVGGSDAPDRLPEVLAWKDGFWELALPPPVTPPVPAPSKRNSATAAVVGVNVPSTPATRPPSNERPRQGTDPMISVDAVKRQTPTRSVAVRPPEAGQAPRMPPGPPMPGLRDRGPTPHSQPVVGARPAQATPAAAPPTTRAPSATAKAPQAAPGAPAGAAKVPAAPAAAKAPQAAPGAPAGAAKVPVAAAFAVHKPAAPRPAAPRPGQIPDESVTPRPASRNAEPQVTPPPRGVASVPRHATPAQGFEIKPPAPPARVPMPPAPSKPQAPAEDLPALVPPAAGIVEGPARPARSRPSKSRPAGPPAIRGAGAATADKAPSVFNTTSGEIRRQNTPVRGIDSHSLSVELPRDMQDPAAFVDTPEPMSGSQLVEEPPSNVQVAQPTLPVEQEVRPSDRLSAFTSVQNNDFGGDTDKQPTPSGRRRGKRGIGRWPLVVHIVLGIVLGIGVVVAYSYFHGLPMSLP